MRIEPEAKNTIERIHLIAGKKKSLPLETIREVFENLFTVLCLDYLERKKTIIPFIGDIEISYIGENIENKKKQAIVDIKLKPCNFLLRNIGQMVDGKGLSGIEEHYINQVRELLKQKLSGNDLI